jgi:hypothetical protein
MSMIGHNGGPPLDLNNSVDRAKVILQLQNDIDKFCRDEFAEDPRTHLGASIIGHDCQAYAWNTFRWLKFEAFDGRMLRLFNRGHEEEFRFVRWLRGVGLDVREVDPETKKQFRIVGAKGHFGGSLDGMCKLPERYGYADPILAEFKTHNAKSFAKLVKQKVIMAKPQHYKQMCSYGRAYGFKFGLYCAVNKDTDDLHFEIVPLDWRLADDLFRKAENIVFAKERPPKIAQTATYFDCSYCDFKGLCHSNEVPQINCRSCRHAYPVDNAEWQCALADPAFGPIPKDFIPKGCASWARIA